MTNRSILFWTLCAGSWMGSACTADVAGTAEDEDLDSVSSELGATFDDAIPDGATVVDSFDEPTELEVQVGRNGGSPSPEQPDWIWYLEKRATDPSMTALGGERDVRVATEWQTSFSGSGAFGNALN